MVDVTVTFVVDPFNENNAADEDGELMGSLRILLIQDTDNPPKVSDFETVPIIGYVRFDALINFTPQDGNQ